MARYEFSDGKSHKFWEIEVDGMNVTTRWGRIGTQGQSKTKAFESVEAAEKEAAKVTRSKTKKGYATVGESGESTRTATPAIDVPTEKMAPAKKKATTKKKATPAKKGTATKTPAAESTKAAQASALPEVTPISASTVELPDESIVDREGLQPFLSPRAPHAIKPLSLEKAWRHFLGKYGGGTALDTLRAASATKITKGEHPVLPPSLTAAGEFLLIARACRTWGYHPGGIIDVAVASHGVPYAVGAALLSIAQQDEEALNEHHPHYLIDFARRARSFVCAADADTRREIDKVVDGLDRADWPASAHIMATYLAPGNTERRARAMAAFSQTPLNSAADFLIPDVENLAEFETLMPAVQGHAYERSIAVFANAVVLLGPDIIDPVLQWLQDAIQNCQYERGKEADVGVASIVACWPSDQATNFLVERLGQSHFRSALADSANHYPVRVLTHLGPIAAGRSKLKDHAAAVVGKILRAFPSALEPASKGWDDRTRKVALAIAESERVAPPASLKSCPDVLQHPRWEQKRAKPKKRKALALTVLTHKTRLVWPKGVKEKWATRGGMDFGGHLSFTTEKQWRSALGKRPHAHVLCQAPKALAKELLPKWRPTDSWVCDEWQFRLVAEFGLETLAGIECLLGADQTKGVAAILPFDHVPFASAAADAYRRLKSARKDARAWLLFHPETAFVGLLPLAFGSKKADATSALAAIAMLVGEGHGEVLIKVGQRYGDDAAAWATELSTMDALDQLPKKIPTLPEWTKDVISPTLKTGGSLPGPALETFLLMLAISKPGETYPGVEMAVESMTPDSLDRFSWSLFDAWQLAGMDSKLDWAFTQMAVLGGDKSARKLTPILRAWPGDGGHARATKGLTVLAAIGSDVAMMNLYGISQKLKFKGLKKKAAEKVQEVAAERGLTELELADRLVPDFDLDESGTLILDFGPRTFVVSFDENLKPVLKDETGKVRKSLPKVGKTDDPEKGAEATAKFKTLKKDLRAVAGMQLTRLEQVMCQERTWTQEDFRAYLLEHPLLIHLVRRLVWGVYNENKTLVQTFRVAEDGSFANAADDEIEMKKGRIGIVHRLRLTDDAATAWGEVFADYEMLQPFDQLGRAVFSLTAEEKKHKVIDRVKDLTVKTSAVLRMEKHGWRRGDPQDGGGIWWMQYQAGGAFFMLNLDPGMIVGMLGEYAEQKLGSVQLEASQWYSNQKGMSFDGVSDIVLSEVLRSIEMLKS